MLPSSPSSADQAPFDRSAYRIDLEAAVAAAFQDSPLEKEQLERLLSFGVLLAERARCFNLTRLTAPEEMALLHFLDTFFLAQALSARTRSVLDIGTGAGIPGIPLAILRPEIQVTLIDGTGKKIAFVKEAIESLGLTNAAAFQLRAEEHLRRTRYGTAVLRASVKPVRMMEIMAECREPLQALVFMLGGDGKTVAKALRTPRYRLLSVEPYQLPGQHKERHIATFIRKMQKRR